MTRSLVLEFRVEYKVYDPKEKVGVVGYIPELGAWRPEDGFPLTQSSENSLQWTGRLELKDAHEDEIQFRYFAYLELDSFRESISCPVRMVTRWETHVVPRTLNLNRAGSNDVIRKFDRFGEYFGEKKVDEGWLIHQSEWRLRVQNNALKFFKTKYTERPVRMLLTPVDLRFHDAGAATSDEDTADHPRPALSSHTETMVSELNHSDARFKKQEPFGTKYASHDYLIFKTATVAPEFLGFFFEFYWDMPGDEQPEKFGSCYLIPAYPQETHAVRVVPITSLRHQPIGQITVAVLLVLPLSPTMYVPDMHTSYVRYWKKRNPLDVGHRGMGSSYKKFAVIRENTIASLIYAANHGADYVEFDVQLSKDLVPIVYHDFYVCITIKRRTNSSTNLNSLDVDSNDYELQELPVKDLKLKQLHLLKLHHTALRKEDGSAIHEEYDYDHVEEHQPFPTLRQLFDALDPHVGFNIEVKYPMMDKSGKWECEHFFERNQYVDKILDVVMNHCKSRRVIFSCFEPDVCTILNLKQNRFPVLFLTQGETSRYPPFIDERTNASDIAVNFAVMNQILGVDFHAEDLLRDSSPFYKAREQGLVSFVWGDDLNDKETLKYFKDVLGVDGVIYDRSIVYANALSPSMDSHNHGKLNVFLVEKQNKDEMMKRSNSRASTPSSDMSL